MNQEKQNMLKDMVFCHVQENLEKKFGKTLTNTAAKTGIDAASKRVVQKTTEETGASKTKSKEKEDETNEIQKNV